MRNIRVKARFKYLFLLNSSMKKAIVILAVALLLFSPLKIKASDNALHIEYCFDKPIIEKTIIGSEIFDVVKLNNSGTFGSVGSPALPASPAYILIPYGKDVEEIKVKAGIPVFLNGSYNVMPVEKAHPIGVFSMPFKNDVYERNDMYPRRLYEKVGTYYFRGFKILVLRLYPVHYMPKKGKLFYYDKMDIEVNLKEGEKNPNFRGLKEDAKEVARLVDNDAVIKSYACNGKAGYDILIITTKSLKRYFEPLKEWHGAHGEPTIIATMNEIGENADDVRTYIKNAYLNLGISYVLIGGDVDVVPSKMLWVSGYDENVTYYETTMPSDLYYACLDGTYNYDNDSKWGEPNDGDGGKDIDLLAEVYVGRACVDNAKEAQNFVKKTTGYADSDDSYLKKVLMAGEYLGDYGIATWGGNYMDQLVNSSDADGYHTVGIPASKFTIEKLYDRDWDNNYWSPQEIISRINDGVHIINHLGHSSTEYNMRLMTDSINELDNDKYCFIYSQGCYAGAFDYDDCIAEYFTVKTSHAAFAGIWNARYGFFWSFSTDGDSQRYHRHFWDAVFGKKIYEIGKANQASKEANLFLINRSMMRWCYYQLNLFGDPAIKFHISEPPAKPARPQGIKKGEAGNEYNFSTHTTDGDGDKIYYMWDWGDGSNTSWLGPYESGEIATASHSWKEKGIYEVRVIAKDENGMISEWSDPSPVTMPYAPNLIEKILEWLSHFFDFLTVT